MLIVNKISVMTMTNPFRSPGLFRIPGVKSQVLRKTKGVVALKFTSGSKSFYRCFVTRKGTKKMPYIEIVS